jgi:NhaP-type Na+/H+ or K+/H+ antiporter
MNSVPIWFAISVLSPLPVSICCTAYFVVQVVRFKFGFKLTTGRFVGRVLLWSSVGFIGAVVLVMCLSAYSGQAQTPFALILFGPLGISCGVVVGTVMWRRNEAAKPNSTPHRDGREASHFGQPSSAPARGRER